MANKKISDFSEKNNGDVTLTDLFVLAAEDNANYKITASEVRTYIQDNLPTLISDNAANITSLKNSNILSWADDSTLNNDKVFTVGSGLSGDSSPSSRYDLRVDPNRAELVSAQGQDYVLIADASDSYNVKKVRADSISSIGELTDVVFTSGQQLITGLKIFKSGASFSGYGTSPRNGLPFRPAALISGYLGITGGDIDITGNTTIGVYEQPNFFYVGTGRDSYDKVGIGGFTDSKLSSIGYPDGDSSISGMVHISGGNVIIEGPSLDPANLYVSGCVYVTGAGGWTKVGAGGGGSTNPAGSNTQVQFNDGGSSFGASENLTFDGSSLKINGNDIYQKSEYNSLSNASNFRLHDYVLHTSMTGIPPNTEFRECSAVCYDPRFNNFIFLNTDTNLTSFQVNKFGQFIRHNAGSCNNFQYDGGFNFPDAEGLCYVSGDMFAVCSEKTASSNNQIILFKSEVYWNGGDQSLCYDDLDTANNITYDLTAITTSNNKGVEGVTYNPEENVFYVITEGVDGGANWEVYEVENTLIDGDEPTCTELFDRSSAPNIDAEEVSDIYYDPNSKHLFITEHDTNESRVWRSDLQGNLIDFIDLKDSFGTNYNQIEGITFTPDGSKMVVVGEDGNNGSDIGFYAISSNSVSGAYINPAILATDDYITSDYTFTYEDAGKYFHINGASDITITLPTGDYNRFNGLQFEVFNETSNAVNVSGDAGVTLNSKGIASPPNVAQIASQYEWAKFWNIRGVWYGAGDIT